MYICLLGCRPLSGCQWQVKVNRIPYWTRRTPSGDCYWEGSAPNLYLYAYISSLFFLRLRRTGQYKESPVRAPVWTRKFNPEWAYGRRWHPLGQSLIYIRRALYLDDFSTFVECQSDWFLLVQTCTKVWDVICTTVSILCNNMGHMYHSFTQAYFRMTGECFKPPLLTRFGIMPLWSWIWWQMAVFLSRTDACDSFARGGSPSLDFQTDLLGGLTCQLYEVLSIQMYQKKAVKVSQSFFASVLT